jgi:predicted transcriptional regulator
MPQQRNLSKLTNREMDILNILWSTGKPMIASEITKADDSLTINTVQVALRNLLKKNLIEVAEITRSRTVLCRSYRPTLNSSEFSVMTLKSFFKDINKDISTIGIISTLLEYEENNATLINELEKLLNERKEQHKGG